jgi:hypothetical protein
MDVTFYSPMHELTDIWVVFNFWLSWIKLLWTFIYTFCGWCIFSFSWVYTIPRRRLSVSYVVTMVTICLTFLKSWPLSKGGRSFYITTNTTYTRVLISPHAFQHLLLSVLWIVAILVTWSGISRCFFPSSWWFKHFFQRHIGYFYVAFKKMSPCILCLFLIGLFMILFYWVAGVLYIDISPPSDVQFATAFPILWIAF